MAGGGWRLGREWKEKEGKEWREMSWKEKGRLAGQGTEREKEGDFLYNILQWMLMSGKLSFGRRKYFLHVKMVLIHCSAFRMPLAM